MSFDIVESQDGSNRMAFIFPISKNLVHLFVNEEDTPADDIVSGLTLGGT